jgi:hypothetical protein
LLEPEVAVARSGSVVVGVLLADGWQVGKVALKAQQPAMVFGPVM